MQDETSHLALATKQPGTKLPSWTVGFWKVSYNEDARFDAHPANINLLAFRFRATPR